ncbi:hypothetical protein ACI2L5_54100, partial [Streptomyces milbemycinicus]
MTGRRRPSSRPIRAAAAALCTVVGASVLTGCGAVLPNDAEDPPITVMTWAPEGTKATNMPGMPAMAKAFARWVNGS